MKTIVIVQARMASTRLPGKILKQVLGRPLLGYLLERIKRAKTLSGIIVATTAESRDDVIVELSNEYGVGFFRGSEDDVLSRYHGASEMFGADTVVRVTSDCPLIDPFVIDRVVDEYNSHSESCDYVSNTLARTYPRGMDCEVFSREALEQAHSEATYPSDREHVTSYIYTRPEIFCLRNVAYASDQSSHRWTVDTIEDFELIRLMIEDLYPRIPQFTLEDCLALIERHPDWVEINRGVRQKT